MKHEVQYYFDKGGNKVCVGDFIVYSTLIGRSAALQFGKVIKIMSNDDQHDICSITVLGVRELWDGPKLCKRKGTLQYTNRTLLANNLICQKYTELYQNDG